MGTADPGVVSALFGVRYPEALPCRGRPSLLEVFDDGSSMKAIQFNAIEDLLLSLEYR